MLPFSPSCPLGFPILPYLSPLQPLMKDLSFFFLKNSMGSKMRRSFRNICKNNNSTSTLNQHHNTCYSSASSQLPSSSSYMENDQNALNAPPRKSVTLEEMILQLELEEEMARKEKAANFRSDYKEKEEEMRTTNKLHHRMSCVNSSDILRSARSALNQYPRFSLDGRDAMYRASFRSNIGPSVDGLKLGRILHLPQSLGGESVIWCKPGVVPKLMGLEAIPVPISRLNNNNSHINNKNDKEKLSTIIRNQNLRRRTQRNDLVGRHRRHVIDSDICCGNMRRSGRSSGGGASGGNGCTSNGYCVMNPIALEPVLGLGGPITWPNPYNYT